MSATVSEMFAGLKGRLGIEEYNHCRFGFTEALDIIRKSFGRGIGAGCPAPDFELPTTDGSSFRLSRYVGKPLLLRFGSIT